MIGIELLEKIQILHELGYIYQDIKPENILIGVDDECNKIYLIDFGLSKCYLTEEKSYPINMKKFNYR